MTSDGDIVNQILRSDNENEKEYMVYTKEPINQKFINKMSNGVPILDTVTKKCFVEQLGEKQFRIILTQGLNRQIRRMTEYCGNKVVKLERYRIMNIELDVPLGKYRELTPAEMKEIRRRLAGASKTSKS